MASSWSTHRTYRDLYQFGTTASDSARDVVVAPTGDLYLTGETDGSVEQGTPNLGSRVRLPPQGPNQRLQRHLRQRRPHGRNRCGVGSSVWYGVR